MYPPLLIVAEEEGQHATIAAALQEDGWSILFANVVAQALAVVSQQSLALVVLALHASSREALVEAQAFCVSVRESHIPLLMVLEPEMEIAQAEWLGLRGDDYLASPLVIGELRACVRTLLRRGMRSRKIATPKVFPHVNRDPMREAGQVLEAGNLRIDVAGRRVFQRGDEVQIGSPLLFDLLVYMVRHRGEVLSPQQLLEHVWGYRQEDLPEEHRRTVYVHMCWLRSLIEEYPRHPRHIQTVRGTGYRFRDEPAPGEEEEPPGQPDGQIRIPWPGC
jgi:DNA-binding response OmpR family regulator